jgi:hypothetical protein
MKILFHILLSSACLSIFYLAYKLVYIRKANFRELRVYLLGSLLISLFVPFSNYRIELRNKQDTHVVMQDPGSQQAKWIQPVAVQPKTKINWQAAALSLYLLITFVLLGRIVLQLVVLTYNYFKSDKIRGDSCVILLNHRFRTTFSFFKWIYVAPEGCSREDLDQIIAHEKIHASQYHSFDLIMMELLTAVMWFNPLVWMMKNSMQLVHEYLADEGALRTGIDKLRYQALLINQITEESLICLSSSFNHSLTKKRLIMMTTSNIYQRTRLKLLTLIPLSASLLLVTAMLNGLFPEKMMAADHSPESKETGLKGINGISATIPGDTIKKEKTVKIISKDNQQDTIITETFTIKVTGDTVTKDVMIWHATKEGDDTSKVIYIFDDKDFKGTQMVNSDSIVKVEVIRKGDKDVKIITVEKTVEIRNGDGEEADDNTLIIIDGVKQTDKATFSKLNPDKIQSVNVVKDKNEIKKYTDKDYDGVIIIQTRDMKK